jgi:hypothetical protein
MSAVALAPEKELEVKDLEIPKGGQKLVKPKAINVFAISLLVPVLFMFQVATGTSLEMALMVSSFLILTSMTIWFLGGLANILSLAIVVLALQHIFVAAIAKIVAGQAMDEPLKLLAPLPTMLMYNLGMGGLAAAAYVIRTFRLDRFGPIVKTSNSPRTLRVVGLVCLALGVVQTLTVGIGGVTDTGMILTGGIFGPLKQLTFLIQISVSALTAAVLLESNSKKLFGFWNTIALLIPVFFGILNGGRQPTLLPIIVLLFTAVAYGYKFKAWHIVLLLSFVAFFERVGSPFLLYARTDGGIRSVAPSERVPMLLEIFQNVLIDPDYYYRESEKVDYKAGYWRNRLIYHDIPGSLLPRYSVIVTADTIVYSAMREGHTGWESTWWGFRMVLPSFIVPDKPILGSSNWVAQRGKGLVNRNDSVTGITLGFMVDLFLSFGFLGVFFGSFVIGFCFFIAFPLCFSTSIWRNYIITGLLFAFVWSFSEGVISAQVLAVLQTLPITVLFLLIVQWLANSATTSNRDLSLRKQ